MCGIAGYKGRTGTATDAAVRAAAIMAEEQNRGQGSAGLALLVDNGIEVITKRGTLESLKERYQLRDHHCSTAIGHLRYPTSGSSRFDMQPFSGEIGGRWLALGINGDTVNINGLPWQDYRRQLRGAVYRARSDSEVLLHHVAQASGHDLVERMCAAFATVEGAWSLVAIADDGRMWAMRDPWGFRPLFYGSNDHGVAIASENSALLGYHDIREVNPGEIVLVDDDLQLQRWQYLPPKQRLYVCAFESVYLKDPGCQGVYHFRTACGQRLAEEVRQSGSLETRFLNSLVVPVLDSGRDAALAFASALGLRVAAGVNRSRLSHNLRAFMAESHDARVKLAELKHKPNPEVLDGEIVTLVEDSILRSDTLSELVPHVKRYARQVNVVVASPRITGPCFYGIATPTHDELIAAHHSNEEIRQRIGADFLYYLSLDGYRSCFRHLSIAGYLEGLKPCCHACDACMSGDYPPFVPRGFQKEAIITAPTACA